MAHYEHRSEHDNKTLGRAITKAVKDAPKDVQELRLTIRRDGKTSLLIVAYESDES